MVFTVLGIIVAILMFIGNPAKAIGTLFGIGILILLFFNPLLFGIGIFLIVGLFSMFGD